MTDALHVRAIELRMLMGMIAKVSKQAFEQHLTSLNIDLSGLQFGIMHTLEEEPMTISELSRRFSLDPSTLVPTIDALERKGLVNRDRDPNDRRRIPITLTDAGHELLERLPLTSETDPLYVSLQNMGKDAADTLIKLMRELVTNLPEGDELIQSVNTRFNVFCAKLEQKPKK